MRWVRDRRKVGDDCPYCDRPLTQEVFDDKRRRQVESLKESFAIRKANGLPIGGAMKRDYAKYNLIYELRDKGMPIRKIAKEVGCACSTVQVALKRR